MNLIIKNFCGLPNKRKEIVKIKDKVYGPVQITSPVLVDLMNSKAMRRLQGIMQHGISALIGITQPVTRFDHSVGVMLLTCRLGASLEEQIAGLLHDVSHTAFSHVIDYVYDNHDGQSFHDEQKEAYISQTDLPSILERHGYYWYMFLDEENFPLLEQESPRLCADRLDYFLRDAQELGLAQQSDIDFVLQHLVVVNGRIAVDNLQAAQWLGYKFMAADDASWANFREVGLYELTARAIKRGLSVGAIDESDIWGIDQPLWENLHTNPDIVLHNWLNLIEPATQFVWDEERPTFQISTKIRTIDPDVTVDGALIPLSELDPEFASTRTDYLLRKSGKWPMRVLPARD